MLAQRYIDAHYAEPDLSLEEVASAAQISPGYLSRLLKLETGFSFVDYLTRVRINKAVQIMSDPAVKVYEVAEAVGYQSQHYFSRAFKRVFGRPPVEYRKGGRHEPRCRSLLRRSLPLALAACGRRPAPEPKAFDYVIGVSMANLTEPWRINMRDEIMAEAAHHPNLRVVFTDAADSNDRQIQDVHTLLDSGIDLLIISPNESEALSPVIAEAYRAHPRDPAGPLGDRLRLHAVHRPGQPAHRQAGRASTWPALLGASGREDRRDPGPFRIAAGARPRASASGRPSPSRPQHHDRGHDRRGLAARQGRGRADGLAPDATAAWT